MYIFFDIGGTSLRVTHSQDLKKFAPPEVSQTPKTEKQCVGVIVDYARKHKVSVSGVIGAAAGSIDRKGIIVSSKNLPQLQNKPFIQSIARALNTKGILLNDAVMAGIGECHFGSAKKAGIVATVVVGTGIGGARFVNGEVDAYNYSFEPGKQVIALPQGKPLTFEAMCSGKAVYGKTGKHADAITDKRFWDVHTKLLAIGIYNTITHWTPDVLVVGGGVILNHIAIQLLEKEIRKISQLPSLRMPHIKKAALGDFSALYGALYLGQGTR